MYVFDYGAPTGFRLAMAHPERVTAIVSQNGNAYEEGLATRGQPIRRYWSEPTAENRKAIRRRSESEGMKHEYPSECQIRLIHARRLHTRRCAARAPRQHRHPARLFLDYANNVKLYPKFQEYFRTSKPPLLAIWGKNDPYFIPPGAEAFERHSECAVQFLHTGHFALETHVQEIANTMRTPSSQQMSDKP